MGTTNLLYQLLPLWSSRFCFSFICHDKSQFLSLYNDALHLVERDLFGTPIIELGRPRAGVVRHLRRLLERPAILQEAVTPVARNVWLPILVVISAALARL